MISLFIIYHKGKVNVKKNRKYFSFEELHKVSFYIYMYCNILHLQFT